MAKEIELSIIIPNYNTHKLVLDCIKSVKNYIKKIKYEIIIINNSSLDSEREILQSYLKENKQLKIINSENRGYGAANNLGIESARGKYLLLLNSDTLIVDSSIEKMLNFITKHEEIGGLTPLIYQKDKKTLQRHFFGQFQNLGLITLKRFRGRHPDLKHDFFYSDTITFAAMMIKKLTFDKVGGFDENFFMYWEDDDLCLRLNKIGLKNAVYNKAKIIHLESQSSLNREKLRMYYKSQSYYWQKHFGTFQRITMEIIRWPYRYMNLLISK